MMVIPRKLFLPRAAALAVGVLSISVTFLGCHDRKQGLHRVVAEQQALLCGALNEFRTAAIVVPQGGTVSDIEDYFKWLGISDQLNSRLKERGLDPKALDKNELVLLLFCGILERHENGDLQWHSIESLIRRPLVQFRVFGPDSRWLTDVDKDGWPEYTLPEKGPVTFCPASFDFPFSCSKKKKGGKADGR